jgi:type IV secretory pathway VirJ component
VKHAWLLLWACMFWGLQCCGSAAAGQIEQLPSREWGTMELYRPDAATGDVLLMFSGAGGIEAQDRKAAQRMLAEGRTVALVDGGAVLRGAKAASGSCLELASIGQWLSQTVQQYMGAGDFRAALLIGRDEGAWVVHSLLAQAPEGVFKAGLSVNFRPGNPTARPLCGVGVVAADRRIAPDTPLNGVWAVADTHALRFDAARYARQAASVSGQGELWVMSGIDYAELASRFMRGVSAPNTLRRGAKTGTTALPLIELPAQMDEQNLAFKDVSVLFVSGDGGWRDIDQQVGRVLADNGLHVLGVDALRYFWRKRTPESVAADLTALLEKPEAGQGATRFPIGHRLVFIGYSFGANILPLVYAHLPQELRERVVLTVLLSPELRTDFEIHMAGWLGAQAGGDAMPILPSLLNIPAPRILCVQGLDEGASSLCSQPALAQAGVEIWRLPGGHHYDEDYPALAMKIIHALRRHLDTMGTCRTGC